MFPNLERLVIKDLNPLCGIQWFDPDETASTLKETILEVRSVIELRAESVDRQLRELHFASSCVPESWKIVEVSGNWAYERVVFDEACWDLYSTMPFEMIPTLDEYLHNVMDGS